MSALGLLSHVLAGLSPFIVAAVMARSSLLVGTAVVYGVGSLLLVGLLAVPRARGRVAAAWRELRSVPLRTHAVVSLAGFLVAGVAYYVGLSRSPRVAEYVFLTRLDWVVQVPVAILVLRETWTRSGLAGAALALAGGLLIVWTGAIGSSGLASASCYVIASLAGYIGATRVARAMGIDGAVTLTIGRHWVNTAGFVTLAVLLARPLALPRDPSFLALATLGAVVLICLFLFRFAALTRLPLWVLSAQAPVQALVALAASRLTEGRPATSTLVAVAMIVSGELLVAYGRSE